MNQNKNIQITYLRDKTTSVSPPIWTRTSWGIQLNSLPPQPVKTRGKRRPIEKQKCVNFQKSIKYGNLITHRWQ
jgi:hypothetical protein